MQKLRVLLVDEDEKCSSMLQEKMLEIINDRIELEVITDIHYFNNLFSTPQKADVLVISEYMYTKSLNKHDIGNVFIMSESGENYVSNGEVVHLYKYGNMKEIVKCIMKGCGLDTKDNVRNKVTQIILVTSASGGVGKTAVSMGIAFHLSKEQNRVLYINAEYMQSFSWCLQDKSGISGDFLSSIRKDNTNINLSMLRENIRSEEFDYLPPFKAALIALGLQFQVFRNIAQTVKESNEYDYIIMDTDSALSEEKMKLLDFADKVVIVMEMSATSIEAAKQFGMNVNISDKEKYMFVCNKVTEDKKDKLVLQNLNDKIVINETIDFVSGIDGNNLMNLVRGETFKKVAYMVE